MIFHPFANDDVGDEDSESVKIMIDQDSGQIDVGELKAYIERINFRKAEPGEPAKQSRIWFIRPHFHLIGYGWIENTQQVYEKTGYVCKNLGVRESVFMTALYQLSHAGYKYGHHTVSWMGVMSNRLYCELNPTPELPLAPLKCPECESEMKPVRWVGEGISPLSGENDEGIYFVNAEGWEYIPDIWIGNDWDPDGGYWKSGLRSRVVKPTDEEKRLEDQITEVVTK